MNPSINEFLEFLDKEDDTDYGDFKREVDLHLMQLAESMRPLSNEQVLQLRRMREYLLWSYKDDIEEVRSLLKREASHLEGFGAP